MRDYGIDRRTFLKSVGLVSVAMAGGIGHPQAMLLHSSVKFRCRTPWGPRRRNSGSGQCVRLPSSYLRQSFPADTDGKTGSV